MRSVLLTVALLVVGARAVENAVSALATRIVARGGRALNVTSPGYPGNATLWTPVSQTWPSILLQPASLADVVDAVSTLVSARLPFRVRGGGHSYAGYSSHTGPVLDMRLMSSIVVDLVGATATIGAGAIWGDVYDALAGTEYAAIGGLCPTVGVSGFLQGGGYNSQYSRMFGLGVDAVLRLEVVTANGTVVNASATENADLYFALRGGGGGTWGVVTEIAIRLHRLPAVAGAPRPGALPWYNITWTPPVTAGPGAAAPYLRSALENWLAFTDAVADTDLRFAFDVYMILKGNQDGASGSFLQMFGVWQGDLASFHSAAAPWLSQAPLPSTVNIQWATQDDVERLWGGPSNPNPNPTRVYVVSALATGMSAPMLDVVMQCAIPMVPGTFIGCGMDVIYLKGAPKDNSTAWAHPQVKFDIAPGLGWGAFRTDGALDAVGLAAGAAWMDALRAAAAPDGLVIGSYLNYIDPYFAGWQEAYHGALLPALEAVKARWDPAQVFSFPQAVLPLATPAVAP